MPDTAASLLQLSFINLGCGPDRCLGSSSSVFLGKRTQQHGQHLVGI